MENGYALVPAASVGAADSLKRLVHVEPQYRVVLPLQGDFSAYVAVDATGGQDVATTLAGLASTFRALGVEGTPIGAQMPTREEPPHVHIGFALLNVAPGSTPAVAAEVAGIEQTLGLAGIDGDYQLLVELVAPDEASLHKAHQHVLTVGGPAIARSAWGHGRVDHGAWRDR